MPGVQTAGTKAVAAFYSRDDFLLFKDLLQNIQTLQHGHEFASCLLIRHFTVKLLKACPVV